jgi:hypothetical protein
MKYLLLIAVVAGMLPLTGCETMTDTRAENTVRVRHAAEMDLRQVNNDIEYLLYIDRPVWLTRYPVPND